MYEEQLKSSQHSEVLLKGKMTSKWNTCKHKCAVTGTVPGRLLERRRSTCFVVYAVVVFLSVMMLTPDYLLFSNLLSFPMNQVDPDKSKPLLMAPLLPRCVCSFVKEMRDNVHWRVSESFPS